MREAVIVSAVRTPVGRANKGTLRQARPEDLGALAVSEAIKRAERVREEEIDDVIIGCAMPEGEQGLNMGRIIAVRAGLPDSVPGMTINRFCSSGLQSIALAAERIMCGFSDVIVAGGVESMSHVPMSGFHPAPNPYLMDHRPEVYMSMGHTAELVAERYGITRLRQDNFALSSHQKAARARNAGYFDEEIAAVEGELSEMGEDGKPSKSTYRLDQDEGIREATSIEALGQLKPAFQQGGTVTAGNSSQMSDGAAAVLVMSAEKARSLGLTPLAYYRSFAVGGVAPEVMGIGPVEAIPKALKLAAVEKDQIDLFEINEAFAAQCLAVIEQLEIDETKVNVNGGAIALGHPLGCTGTKLTVTLLHEAKRRGCKYGMVSMCIGGGMGAAGVFEFVTET